ncbi:MULTISPECIES: metalloregulator ArsR/SmtB family transcription factor [unclassified Methylobacterium]|uniref:ArsR/SmtB family transcription factor n=1 Tax=unclassified Methylobacterium TaxID=2615210 RepID=UPI002269C85A|nr:MULTISPECIES: metalloregulator ArsR/SmtB family transcription factor [unclassified Methylobacterium]
MDNHGLALDAIFHALADPTRRAIVQRLGRGDATVSELARPFDMALPSFVKHISVLERSRLITSQKRGRIRTCRLEPENLATTERWFDELRVQWTSRCFNLDTLLVKLNGGEDDR